MGVEEVQDTEKVSAVRRKWPSSEEEWYRRVDSALSTVLEAPLKDYASKTLYYVDHASITSVAEMSPTGWSFDDQVVALCFGVGVFDMPGRPGLEKWDVPDSLGAPFTTDRQAYEWLMENSTRHSALTKLAWLVTTGQITHD